jgi:hypothetical protein
VADKTYVTIKPICDYRADSVEGRATRVWEVRLKDGSQETFALKDVWMFSDDQTEGDILRSVLSKVKEVDHRYFLSIEANGHVIVDGQPDRTHTLIMRQAPTVCGELLPWPQPKHSNRTTPTMTGSSRNCSVGHPPDLRGSDQTRPKRRGFSDRTHYRIVFREVCESLHDVTNLGSVMKCLHDATKGTVACSCSSPSQLNLCFLSR